MLKLSRLLGIVASLTLSAQSMALTINPPKCSASKGTLLLENAGTARFINYGMSGPTNFLRGMIIVSGCFELVGRNAGADFIMAAGALTPGQFKQGVDAFAGQSVIPQERFGRTARMAHAYIQLQDAKTGQLLQRSFGRNNRADVEYTNWPIPQKFRQSAKSINQNKRSALMGGAVVNAYFELIDKGSVARVSAEANKKANKQAKSVKQKGAGGASGRALAKVVEKEDGYYSKYINSNQTRPTAGGKQGTVTSKSRNKVAVSYSPNHENSTQNLIQVKTLGTFGTDTFSFDEADLGLVQEKLKKFQSWTQTSKDNDMTNVEKELFVLRFRQAQIGKFGYTDNELYTPGRIVIMTFYGEDGNYRLKIANRVGDSCLAYPEKAGIDCRTPDRLGGHLDEARVADLLQLLGNINAIKSQKSKLDLLQ